MSDDRRGQVVVDSYSAHAEAYDSERNQRSCWGAATEQVVASLALNPSHQVVVEVGCGTGRALLELAAKHSPGAQILGIDPAGNMLAQARENLRRFHNVSFRIGRFEDLPIDSHSVDYLFSVFAFHWATDLAASVGELERVLRPTGAMQLFFTGRHTGREFTKETTPIFLRYMGLQRLLRSAGLRQHLTKDQAYRLFAQRFAPARLTVEESFCTYYDDLEGHWSWWVSRAAGHFQEITADKRAQCDREIRRAIQSLEGEKGIPYTIHLLHVSVGL